jgi:hypothetical protein
VELTELSDVRTAIETVADGVFGGCMRQPVDSTLSYA